MKILGIDYGDFSIGLAILDLDLDFIYPIKTIFRKKENVIRKSLAEIENIINENNIKKVVIGLPLNMDGSEGIRVEKTKNFSNKLKIRMPDIEIIFEDERLTTYEAKEILYENNIKKENHKKQIDQVSAMLILESFKERK